MSDTLKRTQAAVNARTGGRQYEFRAAVQFQPKRMMAKLFTDDDVNATFSALQVNEDVFTAKSAAPKETLAYKLATHVLTGGSIDIESTRHLVKEIKGDIQKGVENFFKANNAIDPRGIASDAMSNETTETAGDGYGKKGILKDDVRITTLGYGTFVRATVMSWGKKIDKERIIDPILHDAESEYRGVVQGLVKDGMVKRGKVKSVGADVDFVYVPLYLNPQQAAAARFGPNVQAEQQKMAQKRLEADEVTLIPGQYEGLTDKEIEEKRIANDLANADKIAMGVAVDDAFAFVNDKILDFAKEHSAKNKALFGSTAVDEKGNYHPYAIKKSLNHEGTMLLDSAIRDPKRGNYFFEKGYDSHGNHDPHKAYEDSVQEIKQFLAEKHPNVDFYDFSAKHLDSNDAGGYFKALVMKNPSLDSNEGSAPHMYLPIVDIDGKSFGAQRIANDNYSVNKDRVKINLKGTKLSSSTVFIEIGNGLTADTDVVVIGEGGATVDSALFALFGPNAKNLPNVAGIAAIDSSNLEKLTQKINDIYFDKFGVKKDLLFIVAIDNDMEKSSINPMARKNYERTRAPFEVGATNERNAKLSPVAENAGMKVYNALKENKEINVVGLMTPTAYNQQLEKQNVQFRDQSVRHSVGDINDLVVVYGPEKAREILAPQIEAAALEVTRSDDNRHTVAVKMTPFDATATDFAIEEAFNTFAPSTQAFIDNAQEDAVAMNLAFKDPKFRAFVQDYVAEVSQENPAHFEKFSDLSNILDVLTNRANMQNHASLQEKFLPLYLLASTHFNANADPKNPPDLNTYMPKLNGMMAGDLGKKHPEIMSDMVGVVNQMVNGNMGPEGEKALSQGYHEFKATNFAAIDMLTRNYHNAVSADFKRNKTPGIDHSEIAADTIKANIVDTAKRAVDYGIIAQQLPDAVQPKATPEPEKQPEPTKVDDSPSPDM